MEIKSFITKNKIDKTKLITYGFTKDLIYKKKLTTNLYVIYKIINNDCTIQVFDQDYEEEYLPFNIKNSIGNYVSQVKEKVETITNDIISKCTIADDIKLKLLQYVKDKYNTLPSFPFNDGTTFTLTVNNKWYALFMHVKGKTIGLDEEEIDIINLKNTPEEINKIIDNINIFPAYHMNKKYWITVYLNKSLDESILFKVIDDSYNLVNKNK